MRSELTWVISSSMIFLAVLAWGLIAVYARRSPLEATARKRFTAVSAAYLAGWLGLAFTLGAAGVFQAFPSTTFPVIALGIGFPILVGGYLLRRSATLSSVINAVPLPWLVGVQLYRTFGVVFIFLYALGTLPAAFALPAGIGDVAVGITAPVVAYLLFRGLRWSCLMALAWNLTGILDLVIAVALGFLTSPGPFQTLALENPNTLISAFPLVLVPVFAVPLSVLLHWAALKRLRSAVGTKIDNRETGCRSRCIVSQPALP